MFFSDGAFLVGAKAIQILMPLVTLPIILTSLSIADYGTFSALLATSTLISILIQYGFLYFLPRKVSETGDRDELVKLLLNVLSFQFLLALPLSLIYLGYVYANGFDIDFGTALAIYFFVVLQILTPLWYFQGLQKTNIVLLLQLMSSFLLLTALLILHDNLTIYTLSLSHLLISFLVFFTAALLSGSIRKDFYNYLSYKYIKAILKSAKPEFYQQISPNLYNNGLVVLLSTQIENQTFGIFSVALKVTNAFLGVVTSLCLASYPIIVRTRQSLETLNSIVVLSALMLTLIIWLMASKISLFLLPEHYEEMSFYLRQLSLSPLFIALSRTFGINYLNLIGKQKIAQRYIVRTSIVFGCIGTILIINDPLLGFVVSVMLARLSLAVHGIFYYNRYRKKQYNG